MEAFMFVPMTPGGQLAKSIQEADNRFTLAMGKPRIRVMEESGRSLAAILGDMEPWLKGTACGRQDCFPCRGEVNNRGRCQWESVTTVLNA